MLLPMLSTVRSGELFDEVMPTNAAFRVAHGLSSTVSACDSHDCTWSLILDAVFPGIPSVYATIFNVCLLFVRAC